MTHYDGQPGGRENEERRLGRILALIVLIAEDPGRWTRAELAERYEVSERMITKDLALMRHAGLRIGKHNPGSNTSARAGYYFVTDPAPALLGVCGAVGTFARKHDAA